MAVNALAPYVAKPSTTIVLFIVQNKPVVVFYEEEFQLPVQWRC